MAEYGIFKNFAKVRFLPASNFAMSAFSKLRSCLKFIIECK